MCSSNSWPLLLDLTKEESKRVLRNLELEAYASLVSAFRAQGDLNKQKKKLLQEIQHVLSISTERHRAEIRRAVNDEKLATVADCIAGPDISSEWHIEGRRLVPIMPRLVPQTAFTMTADNIANQQAVKNLSMPVPAATANKDRSLTPKSSINMTTPPSGRTIRATSPASGSNVLVLPSGMSIHIKEDVHVSAEKEVNMKQGQYITSVENQTSVRPAASSISATTRLPSPAASRVSMPVTSRVPIPSVVPQTASPQPASAVKISVAKSPIRHHSVTTTASGQKVIIVSSTMSGSATGTSSTVTQAGSSYIQRAVSAIPVVKSSMSTPVTTTVNTVMYSRSSVMPAAVSLSTGEVPVGRTNVITVSSTPSASGGSAISLTPVYQQSTSTVGGVTPRPRVRTITARPRAPYHSGRATAHTINVPQAVTPSSQSIHIRPSSSTSSKPTIHIKQEGSMKIITQGSPSTAGRILPKPSGSQVLVVTTSASAITMVAKTATAGSGTGSHLQSGKVLNISASGSRILATSSPHTSAAGVVTVNPKTLQLTTVKGPNTATRLTNAATGNKPNVIVVQKAQPKKSSGTSTTPTVQVARTVSSLGSPFEKELVSFLQRQGPVTKDSLQQRSILDRRTGRAAVGDGQPRRHVVVRQRSLDGSQVRRVTLPSGSKSSILAGLMHAVGLSAENVTTVENNAVPSEDSRAVASITPTDENKESGSVSGQSNRWLEYGVQGSQDSTVKVITSGSVDSSAIKALLDLQAGSSHSIKVQGPRGLSTLQLSGLHGEEITLEPMQSEDRSQSPDIQIMETSGLDDTPPAHTRTVQHRPTVKQVQKVHVLQETGNSVQVQIASPEELNQLTSMAANSSPQQIVGEIDPRTGILHTSTGTEPPPSSMQMGEEVTIQVISSEDHEAEKAALLNKPGVTKTIILSSAGEKAITSVPLQTASSLNDPDDITVNNCTAVSSSAEKLDFLSSALNQAQIDLDSYHYVDEDAEKSQQIVTSGEGVEQQPVTLVSILNRPSGVTMSESNVLLECPVEQTEQGNKLTQIQLLSNQDNGQHIQSNVPTSTSPAPGGRLVTKITTNNSRPMVVSRQRTHLIPIKDADKKTASTIHIIKSSSYTPGAVDHLATVPTSSSVSITPERCQFDASNMNVEDLSSQQNMDSDLSSEDILVTSNCSDNQLDAGASVRLSKRKRKPPPAADEIHSPTQTNWTKVAMSVLQKVMRVRGAYKEKGEMNAASWFTQPVDAREVPDYYEIIENPMDFATIKRKLEANQYSDVKDFHADMLLVRDNCHRYNPPGTDVRRDCDEVFNFYAQEYERTLVHWHHSSVSSPAGKRLRLEPGTVCP